MKQIVLAGALAASAVFGAQALAQQNQQPIPDAPRPQSPAIPTTVTPGIGADTSSTSSTTAQPADPGQTDAPATSLPGQSPADADPVPDLPANGQGPRAFTISVQTNFVDVPFTVKDRKGSLVPGLGWRDVRVYENGVRQHMAVFTVDPFPLSVALVIDQSLPYDTMTRVNNALGALPGAFTSYDEVAVFTYANSPKLQTDFTSGTSARLSAVLERAKVTGRDAMYYAPGEGLGGPTGIKLNGGAEDHINPLVSGGPGSPSGVRDSQVPREQHTLNDAILLAAQSLTKAPRDRRRVIYVISDGKEFGSTAKQKEVIRYLQTNRIALDATLVGDSAEFGVGYVDHFHVPLMMRDNVLPTFVNATGGQLFAEYRTNSIEKSFSAIAEEARTQYTVGYYSREPFIDGKYRKLEVRVLRPGLTVIAKDGYYPSAEQTANTLRPVAQNPATTRPPQP